MEIKIIYSELSQLYYVQEGTAEPIMEVGSVGGSFDLGVDGAHKEVYPFSTHKTAQTSHLLFGQFNQQGEPVPEEDSRSGGSDGNPRWPPRVQYRPDPGPSARFSSRIRLAELFNCAQQTHWPI